MKFLAAFAFLCLTSAWAQTAPAPPPPPALPQLPDDTVVAVFEDGGKLTMGDFRKIYAILPPQNQQMALRDRKSFLQQWAFMRKLTKLAEEQKLEEQSPTKDTLEYYRMMILSQAKVNDVVASTTVEPGEIVKYYDVNKDKYKQVKVKAIYIGFGSEGKRTEDEAKTKAEKLLKDVRGGADFVKLVKADSEDETSKAKDGELAVFRPSDNIPDAIRASVFSLKEGDVSEPVRQPNGYYLLRAEQVTYRPLSEVRDEIFTQLRQEHYSKWLADENKNTKVDFPSPAFLSETPAPGPRR